MNAVLASKIKSKVTDDAPVLNKGGCTCPEHSGSEDKSILPLPRVRYQVQRIVGLSNKNLIQSGTKAMVEELIYEVKY